MPHIRAIEKSRSHWLGNWEFKCRCSGMVFVIVMMLAFLVDQALQICCALFAAVWKKAGSKKSLWEDVRSLFKYFRIDSMETLYRALYNGGFEQELPHFFNE